MISQAPGTLRRSSWTGGAPGPLAHRGVQRRGSTGNLASLLGQQALGQPPAALPLAAAWDVVSSRADSLAHGVQQELVVQGVLHTPLVTQLSCMHQYGSGLPDAPPLAAAAGAATAAGAGAGAAPRPAAAAVAELAISADGAVAGKAVCLATPVEPVEEGTRNNATAARAAIARLRAPEAPAARAAAAVVEAEDSFCHIELWQRRVALLECGEMAAEYLQRAAAVRRKRRLALIRRVREARDSARGLLKRAVHPEGAAATDSADDATCSADEATCSADAGDLVAPSPRDP